MDQFADFNQLIEAKIQKVIEGDYTQLIAFNATWIDSLFEKEKLKECKILHEFQSKIQNIENFIECCFTNLELHNLFELAIISYLFGIIVPIKIVELGYSQFLDSIFDSFPTHLACHFFFGLLKIMRIHELYEENIFCKKIATFQSTLNLEKFVQQLFDRQFIECQMLMKGKNRVQDFEKIVEKYQILKNVAVSDLHIESLKDIEKFIQFQNLTIAQGIQIKILNEEYSKTFNLKEIEVATTLTSLLKRDRFIKNESLYVQEGQHLEFKDLFNIDVKRQFIIKKAITAFMNSQGGYLFIGVHDTLVVKGYQLKEPESNLLCTIEQQCIQKIHPSLVQGVDYQLALLPMYTAEGQLLKGQVIIKISLDRNPTSQNVYSFNEMNYDYQAECIFCFQRINDASKVVRSHQFKQLVLTLNKNEAQDSLFRRKYRKNEFETGIVQENSKLRTEDIWKLEQKEYLIMRKVKGSLETLINIIQSIQDESQYIQNYQSIQSNIIIKMSLDYREQFIEQINAQLSYITFTKQENIQVQFYHGPVQKLLMKNEFNQQEIDKFKMSIATELNLNNFEIEIFGKYLDFKATHMKDLIRIYKHLKNQQKIKLEIHWRLDDGQMYKFNKE